MAAESMTRDLSERVRAFQENVRRYVKPSEAWDGTSGELVSYIVADAILLAESTPAAPDEPCRRGSNPEQGIDGHWCLTHRAEWLLSRPTCESAAPDIDPDCGHSWRSHGIAGRSQGCYAEGCACRRPRREPRAEDALDTARLTRALAAVDRRIAAVVSPTEALDLVGPETDTGRAEYAAAVALEYVRDAG